MTQRLPTAVYQLALRLGADPRRAKATVRLGQTGSMREVVAATWMTFRAERKISNLHCAFEWRARTGPLRSIFVRDALAGGRGRLDVRVLGFIPIGASNSSPQLTRGELMRHLAELAWAPDAILHDTELRWREDGPDTLAVSAGAGETETEVVLTLDDEGRIGGAFAPDRPRAVKASFLPTPRRGRFSDYRRHDDRWLPFAGEVAWVIDGVETVYFQGQIEHWGAG